MDFCFETYNTICVSILMQIKAVHGSGRHLVHSILTVVKLERAMRAKDLMTTKVVTIRPENSIWHAVQIMMDRDVSGLPVINDSGDLVGIITEGDLLRRIELGAANSGGSDLASAEPHGISAYLKSLSWKVDDVMSRQLVAVEDDATLSHIATLMDQHKIRRVLVVHQNKLIGIISRKDLLRAIAVPSLHDIAAGDEAMRLSIVTRLGEISELQRAQLTVTVSDGVVHLGGMVGSEAERSLACAVAESIRSVGAVCDEMQIATTQNGIPTSKLSAP
jgi:CBS domain-containing protein